MDEAETVKEVQYENLESRNCQNDDLKNEGWNIVWSEEDFSFEVDGIFMDDVHTEQNQVEEEDKVDYEELKKCFKEEVDSLSDQSPFVNTKETN